MTDTDDLFEQFLAAATLHAPVVRNSSLAGFIALKTANDALRTIHSKRFFDLLTSAAAHAAGKGVAIDVEHADGHRFKIEKMTLAGEVYRFRHGIRCLTAEAGWTRTPSDGFMRGNALAVARLSHFGYARETEELHLLKFEDEPRWFRVAKDATRISFEPEDVVRHFRLLLSI